MTFSRLSESARAKKCATTLTRSRSRFGHVLQCIQTGEAARSSLVPPKESDGTWLEHLKRDTPDTQSIFLPLEQPFAKTISPESGETRSYRSVSYRGSKGLRLHVQIEVPSSGAETQGTSLAAVPIAELCHMRQTSCLMPDQ